MFRSLLLIFFCFLTITHASHYYSATIQWRQISNLTVSFTVWTAWDGSAQNPFANVNFGDGKFSGDIIGLPSSSVDQFGGYDVYRVANITHTYSGPGPWIVSINSCCRNEVLLNVATEGHRYIISSTVTLDPYIYRRSPVTLLPPVLQFQQTIVNSFTIPIVYPDGLNPSDYTCSFTSPAASGIPINPPASPTSNTVLSLSSVGGVCTLSWDLTNTHNIEGYAAQVTISNPSAGISISLDFMIGVVLPGNYDCNFASNPNVVVDCPPCAVGTLPQNCPPCDSAGISWTPTIPNGEIFLINGIPADTFGFSLSPPVGQAVGQDETNYGSTINLANFTFASQIPTGVTFIQCPQNNCDEYCANNVQLGFTFQFYGNLYSDSFLSSNGLIYFGNPCISGDYDALSIPDNISPGNFIAVFWTDLNPAPGTWWYTTVGTAPNRAFLLTYENSTFFDDTSYIQAQLILYETTNHIEIDILSGPSERQNKLRTIGIEGPAGTIGVQSFYGIAPIVDTSFKYVESAGVSVFLNVVGLQYPQDYVGYILFEEVTPCIFSRYITQQIAVNFIPHELVPGATILPVCDDCCGLGIPLQFNMDYFGSQHSIVTPESNGFLTIADECQSGLPDDFVNSPIPSTSLPNQMIAVQLADLDIRQNGTWWTSTIGQSPNRIFLLTYEGVSYFGLPSTVNTTCQIQIYETSSIIQVHIVSAPANNVLKTVGIENNDGTIGIQSLRTPLPITNVAFSYTPICDRREIYCPYTLKTSRFCTLSANSVSAAPTCANGRDGTVTVTTTDTGGAAYLPITYLWIGYPNQTTNVFTGPAGQYSVIITDNANCQLRLNVTIPAAPVAPFSVTAAPVGAVCYGTGGAIYQTKGVLSSITWFGNGLPTAGQLGLLKPNPVSIDYLIGGSYFGRAYFAYSASNICYDTNIIYVSGPSSPLTATYKVVNVLCNGQNTGSITVNPTGGSGTYSIVWSGPIILSPQLTANNLVAGLYNFTITDSLGCVYGPITVTVSQPPPLVVNFVSAVAPTCFGRQDGSITFSVSGGPVNGTYSISWLDFDSDPVQSCCLSRNYLGSGSYRLIATDKNGCSASNVGIVPAYNGPTPCNRVRLNPNGPCNDVTSCPNNNNPNYYQFYTGQHYQYDHYYYYSS